MRNMRMLCKPAAAIVGLGLLAACVVQPHVAARCGPNESA